MERFKAFALSALVIGAIGVMGAPAASAAGGSVDISCGTATYHYTGFGAGSHTVTETLDEETAYHDFIRIQQVQFTFTGDSADHVVEFHLDPGPHTVRASSSGLPTPTSLRFVCEAPPEIWGDVEFSCGQARYHYEGFGDGTHTVQETIYEDTGAQYWNRLAQVEFTFTGDSGDHVVDFDPLPIGAHTLRGDAWHYPTGGHIAGFAPPRPQAVQCDPPPPPSSCPTGQISVRFGYTHGDKSGTGSAAAPVACPGPTTLRGSLGVSAMRVAPGGRVDLSYSFQAPAGMTVSRAQVTFPVRCEHNHKPSSSSWTVNLPAPAYSAAVPNFCAGGKVRLDRGGTFLATVG